MVRTGASSYVRYDWEDTFGTAAFNNSTHKAFGLNARLGSWTLGHSPKDLPRLNQVEVAQYEPHTALEDARDYEVPILANLVKRTPPKQYMNAEPYNWRNFAMRDWFKPK